MRQYAIGNWIFPPESYDGSQAIKAWKDIDSKLEKCKVCFQAPHFEENTHDYDMLGGVRIMCEKCGPFMETEFSLLSGLKGRHEKIKICIEIAVKWNDNNRLDITHFPIFKGEK